jgi:medium-chain acyl-[acyl-carrier-protein] hydrolase
MYGGEAGSWVGNGAGGAHDAPGRLFCFAHAGGGAAFFRPWCKALAPEIDVRPVQLPGREWRLDEPPYRRIEALVEPLCAALEPYLDRPYAFFGHSMGSMVAFEVARRLGAGGRPAPSCLMVSGRRAPRLAGDRRQLYRLPDNEFLVEVGRLGGLPREVLAEPELREMLLPALRADYEAVETYRPLPGGRLRCPVVAYLGAADPEVDQVSVTGWGDETTGELTIRVFPGDHFYLKGDRPDVLAAVRQDVFVAEARIA